MKTCRKCGVEKETSSFSKKCSHKDGLQHWCKTCIATAYKDYYKRTAKEQIERVQQYIKENKEHVAKRHQEYKKRNRAVYTAIENKRRAAKLQRTPAWLTEKDHKVIEAKYAMSLWLSEVVGQQYHVDHIIPLQGKNVSGLHIPDNLRIIPAKENMSKNNKWSGY